MAKSKKNKYRGIHLHRYKHTPEEKAFADAWVDQNEHGNNLAYLLDERTDLQGKPPEPGARDHLVAATVIQWLGSPVGRIFLRELGYSKEGDPLLPGSKKPCDCFQQVNKLMAKRNGVLVGTIVLKGQRRKAHVAVTKLDTESRVKPGYVAANHCPFCGEKYPDG